MSHADRAKRMKQTRRFGDGAARLDRSYVQRKAEAAAQSPAQAGRVFVHQAQRIIEAALRCDARRAAKADLVPCVVGRVLAAVGAAHVVRGVVP